MEGKEIKDGKTGKRSFLKLVLIIISIILCIAISILISLKWPMIR
jgi:hypothetical protein